MTDEDTWGYDRRRFVPKHIDDLNALCLPFIGQIVHVRSWHSNMWMRENYPEDELVGNVSAFGLDVPESELLSIRESRVEVLDNEGS